MDLPNSKWNPHSCNVVQAIPKAHMISVFAFTETTINYIHTKKLCISLLTRLDCRLHPIMYTNITNKKSKFITKYIKILGESSVIKKKFKWNKLHYTISIKKRCELKQMVSVFCFSYLTFTQSQTLIEKLKGLCIFTFYRLETK